MYKGMVQRNHFVSRGYLRFFAKDGKITVKDKESRNTYVTNIENVCVKKNIYNCIENNEELSWESFYTNIDNIIPKVIGKTISNCKLLGINKPLQDKKLKEDLALIIVIQMLRTPERIFSQTETYDKILNDFYKELKESETIDKEKKLEFLEKLFSREYYKGFLLRDINMPDRLVKYVTTLLNKTWIIYRNNLQYKFYTSDNPVVLYNFLDKSVGLENGIGRTDTIILYPISPEFLIELVPTQYLFGELFRKYNDKCILIENDNFVKRMNQLQYQNAKRQIFGGYI